MALDFSWIDFVVVVDEKSFRKLAHPCGFYANHGADDVIWT